MSANLEGQLLYDLTLKTSFSVKDLNDNAYTIAINGWTEKAISLARTKFPAILGPQPVSAKTLPVVCHVWRPVSDGCRMILLITKNEGLLFSDENGFTDPVWRFDLMFDNELSGGNSLFVLPVAESANVVLLLDAVTYQSYMLDVNLKKCNEISFDLSGGGNVVGFWNLPVTFQNEKSVFILSSFGDWRVFNLNTMRSALSGRLDTSAVLTSSVFLPKYWLIVVGYASNVTLTDVKKGESGLSVCFSTYRLASSAPYVTNEESSGAGVKQSLSSRFPFLRRYRPNTPLKMNVSPSQSSLCVLHESGFISVWALPSMKLKNVFTPDAQRNFSQEPSNTNIPRPRTVSQIFWWSDDCLALLFMDGAFTVCSAEDMHSVIGESAEWFESSSVMSLIPQDASFLIQKQPSQNQDEEMENRDLSIVPGPGTGVFAALRNLLGYFSLQPPKMDAMTADSNGTTEILELWSFQRVTPEELFEIKLENEEYGDALILAKAYSFDTDLIHLRRWKKEPVSHASIEDFLAKVSNRRTAINECMTRVAETLDGQRDLLDFGSKITDPSEAFGDVSDSEASFLSSFLQVADRNVVDMMASLKTHQAEIMLWHFRITEFTKRLHMYESLLAKNSHQHYDASFYSHLRDGDIFELSVEAARDGNVCLVETIFAHYANALAPYRLLIVSNFPETLSPNDYVQLLPGRNLKLIKTEFDAVLNSDFARQMLLGQTKYKPALVDVMVAELPELSAYLPQVESDGSLPNNLPPETLTKWFLYRAEEIESVSWNFDNAVQLLGFGKDSGVVGLDDLFVDLKILSLLVYSCGLKTFSLSALRSSQPMDILKFLLANSRKTQPSQQLLEKHIKIWFQPYADLLESKFSSRAAFESVFVKFLAEVVRNDLEFVVLVLRLCSRKESRLLIEPLSLLTAAVESVYACNDPESIPLFDQILSYLPSRKQTDDLDVLKRHNEIERIKALIEDCKVLAKYGLSFTIAELRDIAESSDKCRDLLNRMMIHILRTATKDRASNFFWNCVLADGLKLVDSFNLAELTREDFLEIYARHLLMFGGGSGSRLGKLVESSSLVNMAKMVLTFSQAQSSDKQGTPSLSYGKSARLAVGVAKELFESAADLDDSSLNRARQCLELISKQYVAIDDELCSAFGEINRYLECCELMRQLETPIVPLSLKVSGDRLGLLANVISASAEACLSKPLVFLRLAELLEVSDDKTESRNLGLKLLASCAINRRELDSALSYCEQIVAAGFVLAWQECAQLCELRVAEQSSSTDDPSRLFPLLAFALAHCDSPSRMRSLIAVRQRIVADHCSLTLQPQPTDMAGKVVGKVVTTVAKEIGDRTTSGLKQATSLIFSDKFLPIVSIISQSLPEQRKKAQQGEADSVPFSARLDSFSDQDVGLVKRFIRTYEPTNDIALMLRLACISSSERLTASDNGCDKELERQIINIAKELVSVYLDGDLAFVLVGCLGIALSINDPNTLISMLDLISPTWPPNDPKAAVLVSYIAALFIEKVSSESSAISADLLQMTPVNVISNVYSRISENEDQLKQAGALGERFLACIDTLFKMDESKTISEQLPPGVNVDDFFADEKYRTQIILSMATENFEQAITLADRYKMPTTNIRLKFAQHTIFKSALSGDGGSDNVKLVVGALAQIDNEDSEHAAKVVGQYFRNEILPKIPGSDHQRIAFMFRIVDALSSQLDLSSYLPAHGGEIAALLCHHELSFENVDFHVITKKPSEEELRKLVDSVVDDSSLANVVKLMQLLPQDFLNASVIYRRWSVKKFTLAVSQLQPVDATSIASAANSVDSYFVHLTPKDFADFMFDVYSSDSFVKQKVPSSAKQALLKRFLQSLKTAKAKQAKDKAAVPAQDWSAAQEAFRLLARHMDRLNSSHWLQFELVIDSSIYTEIRTDFDRTLSREPALTTFVSDWLSRLPSTGSGLGPEVVELLLSCFDFRAKTVSEAYPVAFRHQLASNVDPSPLVLAVSKWNKIGKGALVTDIFSSFREIVFAVIVHGEGADMTSLTPQKRLQLLHHILDASGGQLNLSRAMLIDVDFLYLQLNACLQDNNVNVTREELATEDARAQLLGRIKNELPWQASVELIKILPPFEDASVRSSILIPLLKHAAHTAANSTDKQGEISNFACLVRELFTDKRINIDELLHVADTVAALGFHSFAIIICLISPAARDSPAILNYLSGYEPSTLNMRQPLLCSELLENGLLYKFAGTPYFVPLVDYAVSNQSTMSFTIPQLIDQLSSFGLEEEVEFVRKRVGARARFGGAPDPDEADSAAGSLLGSVSGAFRKWF